MHQFRLTLLLILCTISAFTVSRAEPLAVIFEGCTDGQSMVDCHPTKMIFDIPKPTDIVQTCTSTPCWSETSTPIARIFGQIDSTTLVDGCDNPSIARGAVNPLPWNPATELCGNNWAIKPASQYITPSTGWKAVLNWAAPTENTDGTPLTDLQGFRIYSYLPGGEANPVVTTIPSATTTSYTFDNLSSGLWTFYMDAFSTAGMTSAVTPTVQKMITPLPTVVPLPPTATVSNVEVFQVLGTVDKFQFLPVGTVPPTTQCIVSQSVNGYYAVPAAAVTWYGSVRPKIVVARCN